MRGTKLIAYRFPPLVAAASVGGSFSSPEGSMVGYMQRRLFEAMQNALAAIAADVRQGLLELIGLESEWWTDDTERASVVVHLPENIDPDYAARAIDLENLETWLDDESRLHIAIAPWYSTKDVDQTVLCAIKVLHQFTGLLGIDYADAHNHRH